jgi:tripartite-type tricarboxylate transporter receptor subunit TctC
MPRSPIKTPYGLRRRSLLRLAVISSAAVPFALPSVGFARFPNKAIRLIVPWAAGGPTDVQMRAMAQLAARELRQPIFVENRPGARGTFGAAILYREAQPDGYTLAQIHAGVLSHPFVTRSSTWDAATDFTYILAIAGHLSGMVVRADARWQTWHELIADIRAQPGTISIGTSGVGTGSHLVVLQIMESERLHWLHVPYRGAAETTTALLSGHVDAIADASSWAPHVENGRMRLLTVWSDTRARRFPDVPTIKELGYAVTGSGVYGLAGPRGMDPSVVTVLHDAFKAAIDDPTHLAVLDRLNMPLHYMNGVDFQRWVAAQIPIERDLIQRLAINLDAR